MSLINTKPRYRPWLTVDSPCRTKASTLQLIKTAFIIIFLWQNTFSIIVLGMHNSLKTNLTFALQCFFLITFSSRYNVGIGALLPWLENNQKASCTTGCIISRASSSCIKKYPLRLSLSVTSLHMALHYLISNKLKNEIRSVLLWMQECVSTHVVMFVHTVSGVQWYTTCIG